MHKDSSKSNESANDEVEVTLTNKEARDFVSQEKTMKQALLSVRTFGGYMAHILIAFACIGYLFKNGFNELPNSYLGILSGIIVFYYTKDTWRNLKFGSK